MNLGLVPRRENGWERKFDEACFGQEMDGVVRILLDATLGST